MASYRKYGRVAHFEHGHLLIADEAGESFDDGRCFTSAPLREAIQLPEPDGDEVARVARAIGMLVTPPLTIERLIVSHGHAEHRLEGRRWTDEKRRVHMAIAGPAGERILLDRGTFDLDGLAGIIETLGRLQGSREAPARLRLAPAVTAAALPSIVGLTLAGAELWQTAGGIDGNGLPINEVRISNLPAPNWYRPSYRVRPVRMPLNLDLRRPASALDPELPEAIAILAPANGAHLRLLVKERKHVYAATLHLARITGAGSEARWYPYGGGAWGREVTT